MCSREFRGSIFKVLGLMALILRDQNLALCSFSSMFRYAIIVIKPLPLGLCRNPCPCPRTPSAGQDSAAGKDFNRAHGYSLLGWA